MAVVRARSQSGSPVSRDMRICVHFHPDHRSADGRTALESILDSRRYLSQFVTGTSNGGLTAHPGGDRWRWESELFDGAYDDAPPVDRPVYGALAVDDDHYGPSPRFGSCYLRLRRSVVDRTTFAYPDSALRPAAFGVAEQMGLAPLLRHAPMSDPLDRYIEAHVHGGITVPGDVEALVIDPAYRDTIGVTSAVTRGIPVEHHGGYALDVETLTEQVKYRGPEIAEAARRLGIDGPVTPPDLARARRSGTIDPQMLKLLWHCLARYGRIDGPPIA